MMAITAKLHCRTLTPFYSAIISNPFALQSQPYLSVSVRKLYTQGVGRRNTKPDLNRSVLFHTSASPSGRRLNNPMQNKYDFTTPHTAKKFVKHLQHSEIENLLAELQKREQKYSEKENENLDPVVSKNELKSVFWFNFVPFVAFGFLDNAIMIMAGEFIEMNIGVKLGISTMAAAAWGNIISDVAGIGLAGYVEIAASRCGLKVPDLTVAQSCLTSTRVTANLGKGVGIVIGCILGMVPLLFLKDKHEEKSENCEEKS